MKLEEKIAEIDLRISDLRENDFNKSADLLAEMRLEIASKLKAQESPMGMIQQVMLQGLETLGPVRFIEQISAWADRVAQAEHEEYNQGEDPRLVALHAQKELLTRGRCDLTRQAGGGRQMLTLARMAHLSRIVEKSEAANLNERITALRQEITQSAQAHQLGMSEKPEVNCTNDGTDDGTDPANEGDATNATHPRQR